MPKILVLVLVVGACIGTLGGLIGQQWLFNGGGLIITIATGLLALHAIRKDPLAVMRDESNLSAESEGMPPRSSVEAAPSAGTTTTLVVRAPSNTTPHADARKTDSASDKSVQARAGGRER